MRDQAVEFRGPRRNTAGASWRPATYEAETEAEPEPLPPPFPVGARLLYVGDRVIRSAPGTSEVGVCLLRPGIEAQIVEAVPGTRGTGRVICVDDDGVDIVDRTRHGHNVWVNVLGQRRLIRAEASQEWAPLWGPFAVGDVVLDGTTSTGVVYAAGPQRFSVLWDSGHTGTHAQDCRVYRRFVAGTWGDRAKEEGVFAERRADLAARRAGSHPIRRA